MGGHFVSDATMTAPKVAASIGRNREKLPVSSTARMIPVRGARTTEAKKAAIPMIAKCCGVALRYGIKCAHTAKKRVPAWAPTASIGAKRPPGVRVE